MPDSITLDTATLQADGKTVVYVFDVDITPPPSNGTSPTIDQSKVPLIGKHLGTDEDKIADHDGTPTVGDFDSSTSTVTATVVYDGLFFEDQDTEVIGSGTLNVPNVSSGSTAGWIKFGTSPNFISNESVNGIAIDTSMSDIGPASFLSATVGKNTNPPSLGDDYWEIKFTFDSSSGETPVFNQNFLPQFQSTDAARRLFVKSVDSTDFTGTTITVTGTLSRAITSSETIKVSVPSAYITTESQASVRVYDQSTTNNSPALQLGQFPDLTLRTFPDGLDNSSSLKGPTCVGVTIDPRNSDPGAEVLWSRCTVKHTITIEDGSSNVIELPTRYQSTDDPRDGYEDAVDGHSSPDPFVRNWEKDGKGYAHCIVAVEGVYTWVVEVTNEFGKTDSQSIQFTILARNSANTLYVDSNASGSSETGTQADPFLSIFDVIPKTGMLLDDDYIVEIAEGHSESFGADQVWSTAGKTNVWVRRANLSGPDSTQPRFLQTVDSEPFMFGFGNNDEGVVVEGIRLVPTTDTSNVDSDPDKYDPGIGFASAMKTRSDRTAFVNCVVEGEIDETNPRKVSFDNDRFNYGIQFQKANEINGSLLLNCRTEATRGYGIAWEKGDPVHWGVVVLGGYYGPSSNESSFRTTHQHGLCGLTLDSVHLQDDTSKSAIRVYGGLSGTWPTIMGFVGRCQLQDGDTWIGAVNGQMVTDVRVWANRLVGGNTNSGSQPKMKSEWNGSQCTFVSNVLDLDHSQSKGIATSGKSVDFVLGRFSPNPNGSNLIAHNTLIDVVVPKQAILINEQNDPRPSGYLGNFWLNNLHSSLAARNSVYLEVKGADNLERFDGNVFTLETDITLNNPVSISGVGATTVNGLNNSQSWASGNLAIGISTVEPDPDTLFPDSANGAADVAPINGVHLDYYGQPVERVGGSDVIAGAVMNEPS